MKIKWDAMALLLENENEEELFQIGILKAKFPGSAVWQKSQKPMIKEITIIADVLLKDLLTIRGAS